MARKATASRTSTTPAEVTPAETDTPVDPITITPADTETAIVTVLGGMNTPTDDRSNEVKILDIKRDVAEALDLIGKAGDQINRLNQRVAHAIMQYAEAIHPEGKPDWSGIRATAKSVSAHMKNMRDMYAGEAPKVKRRKGEAKTVSEGDRVDMKRYNARAKLVNDGAKLAAILGSHGVTSDAYDATLGMFRVPPIVLMPDGFTATFSLAKLETVLLNGDAYVLAGKNKAGKDSFMDINASVSQINRAARPMDDTSGDSDDEGDDDKEGDDTGKGANERNDAKYTRKQKDEVYEDTTTEMVAEILLKKLIPETAKTLATYSAPAWEAMVNLNIRLNNLMNNVERMQRSKAA